MLKLTKQQKALLSLALGLVLMVIGFAIDPLVQLGYIPPLVGSIIGVSLPLGVEEVETGKISITDIENVASKVIAILEGSGKLNPKEQAVAQIAGDVLSSVEQSQTSQPKA